MVRSEYGMGEPGSAKAAEGSKDVNDDIASAADLLSVLEFGLCLEWRRDELLDSYYWYGPTPSVELRMMGGWSFPRTEWQRERRAPFVWRLSWWVWSFVLCSPLAFGLNYWRRLDSQVVVGLIDLLWLWQNNSISNCHTLHSRIKNLAGINIADQHIGFFAFLSFWQMALGSEKILMNIYLTWELLHWQMPESRKDITS